jgi:predicted nucleotidyltransferase
LAVFGSVLRSEEFRSDSDVDFLVTFENPRDLGPWMSRLSRLAEDLQTVVGRSVDVALRDQLKWVIRDRVLASAQVIYARR